MTRLKFSAHALTDHADDEWNAPSIVLAALKGAAVAAAVYEGATADALVFRVLADGALIGLFVSKVIGGARIVITGFRNDDPGYSAGCWFDSSQADFRQIGGLTVSNNRITPAV